MVLRGRLGAARDDRAAGDPAGRGLPRPPRLPPSGRSVRDERYREWTAELPAILADPDVRPVLRSARALRFAAGTIRTARREHGVFRGRLTGADARSAGVRLFICASLWLAVACLVRVGGALHLRAPHGIWIGLLLVPAAAAVEVFALAQVIKLARWLCQHD